MTQSFIHADIFFIITTAAVVVFTIGMIVAFFYLIKIFHNVREITDKARLEWDGIVADSQKLRGALRDEGLKWKHVIGLARTFFMRGAERAGKAENEQEKEKQPDVQLAKPSLQAKKITNGRKKIAVRKAGE